jgi:AcrR family transcriptional regulator
MVLTELVNMYRRTGLNEKFLNLPPEKQDRIINAALTVFGKYGYKKASVEEIVKNAGISKGLIFHYFGSKSNLYRELYEYCLSTVTKQLLETVDPSETDFFDMLEKNTEAKLNILKQHPSMYEFLLKAYFEPETGIHGAGSEDNAVPSDAFKSFFKYADTAKFKDEVSLDKALNILLWCSNGFMQMKGLEGAIDPGKALEEFSGYLALLRSAFYKEEYL